MRRQLASLGIATVGAAAGFALAAMISLGLGGATPTTQAAMIQPVAAEAVSPVEAPAALYGVEYGGESCGL